MRLALAIGGLLLTTQVILLVLMLTTLQSSHEHIRAQDRKITALFDGTKPLLDEAEPLAKRAREAIGPLARRGDEIAIATDVLPGLALATRELAAEATPALGRLPRLADLTEASLPELRRITAESLEIQKRSLTRQDDSLVTQRRSLRILRRSLAIQEQSLRHIQSLDRKTGGELPG